MIIIKKFSRLPVITGVCQGMITGPILLNIFNNDLDVGKECTLSKDTKLRRVVDTLDGFAAIQSVINKLEKWVERKLNK